MDESLALITQRFGIMRTMDIRTAKRNAQLAIGANFFNSLSFILPIWLLYSVNELGLSSTAAVAVFMGVWLTSGLLEIPTGALSDRLGRKKVFIIGNVLLAIYPLAYVLGLPLLALIGCCIVSGLGNAMRSGALTPLVHKSYGAAGLSKKSYNAFLSSSHVTIFVGRALSGITGAAMYTLNPKLPFLAMFVATILNVILGTLLSDQEIEEKTATNRQHIGKTLALVRQSHVLMALLVSYVAFSVAVEALWTGYQLFFEADQRSALIIGGLYSIIAVVSALGAYTVRFMFPKVHPVWIMAAYGWGAFLTATLIFQPHEDLRLLAVIPMAFVSGISFLTIEATTQDLIANRYQSTALSVSSFLQYAVYAVGSLMIGISFDMYGVDTTRRILFVQAGVVALVVTLYLSLQSRKTKDYRIEVPEPLTS